MTTDNPSFADVEPSVPTGPFIPRVSLDLDDPELDMGDVLQDRHGNIFFLVGSPLRAVLLDGDIADLADVERSYGPLTRVRMVTADAIVTAPETARPSIGRRELARIANDLAEIFERNGWTWAKPPRKDALSQLGNQTYIPTAADIALAISERIPDLTPGGSISSGRIGVRWDQTEGEPDQITVHLDLGSISEEPQS